MKTFHSFNLRHLFTNTLIKNNHNLSMILLIVCALISQSFCQYTSSSCIYTQTFNIFDASTPQPSTLQGYTFQLNWYTPQENIVNHSFVLSGYALNTSGKYLSYDAGLTNVTATGARFYFNPTDNSEIMRANFTIILSKTCGGLIQLQLIDFTPNILSQSVRGDREYYNVTVAAPWRPTNESYQSEAIISSYRLSQATGKIELKILTKQFTPGNNYQTIELYSFLNNSNIFTRISFTYILIDIATFGMQGSYFNTIFFMEPTYTQLTDYNNLEIPAQFNPYLGFKCIIGLKWIFAKILDVNIHQYIINIGNNIISNFANICQNKQSGIMFSQFCLQSCISNCFVDYNASSYICRPCPHFVPNCKICLNHVYCSTCAASYFLFEQQCYLSCPTGYYPNTTNSMCMSCANSSLYILINGKCACKNGLRLVSNLCLKVDGCMTAFINGNAVACKWCNNTRRFSLNPQGICECDAGFYQDGQFCLPICGDGKLYDEKCDDSNTVDGDGCSSHCAVESNYNCVNGSNTAPSICIYYPQNIGLTLSRIDKIALENVGVFQFKIRPFLANMLKFNLTKDTKFACNQNISLRKVFLSDDGQLTLYVEFFEDLQGNSANFNFQLQPRYFTQKIVAKQFNMVSNGIKLVLIKDLSNIAMAHNAVFAFSIVILVLFALSLLTHKMIGVQMMHTLQIIYLTHLTNRNYTFVYSLIQNLASVTFDFLSNTNDHTSMYATKESIPYSNTNLNQTLSIMNAILLPLLVLIFIIMVRNIIRKQEAPSQIQKKGQATTNFHSIFRFAYSNLIYPLSMVFFFVYLLTFNTKCFQDSNLSIFNIAQILCIGLVFFHEWKIMTVQTPLGKNTTGLKHCKSNYIPSYLTLMLLSVIIIKASYHIQSFSSFLPLIVLYTAFAVLFFVYQPYKDGINNIGVGVQLITLIYFCVWSGLKDYGLITQTDATEVFLLLFLMIMILIVMVIAVIRIIFQFKRTLQSCDKQKPTPTLQYRNLLKSERFGINSDRFYGTAAKEEHMKKIEIEKIGKKYQAETAQPFKRHETQSNLVKKKRLRTNHQQLGAQFL